MPAGPHSKPQIRKPAALPRPCPEPDTKSASMTRRLSRSSSESCLTTPNYVNVERQHEGRLSFVYEGNTLTNINAFVKLLLVERLKTFAVTMEIKLFISKES